MRRYRLIVNPAAAGGKTREKAPAILKALRSAGIDAELIEPGSVEETREVARTAHPDDVLIAMGGDGFLAELATGAVISGAVIAPLPGGRGNDFIRALGVDSDMAIAASRLDKAVERKVDVAWANDKAILGVASVGYDSLANEYANEFTFTKSSMVYLLGAIRALKEAKVSKYAIELDGKQSHITGWAVAIGNSGRYGGGMRICPKAELDDGQLDIVMIGPIPKWRFVSTVARVLNGTHVNTDQVNQTRAKTVVIDSITTPKLMMYSDGDPLGHLPITIEVKHRALRVLS